MGVTIYTRLHQAALCHWSLIVKYAHDDEPRIRGIGPEIVRWGGKWRRMGDAGLTIPRSIQFTRNKGLLLEAAFQTTCISWDRSTVAMIAASC